jgi:flotillin
VAENLAEAEKGRKRADTDKRIYVQRQEAEAVAGENTAKADIADAEAQLAIKQANALKLGEVARREAEVEIQKAQYRAEEERLKAVEVVQQEIEKLKVEIAAEAEAERIRREAKGGADAILLKYEAEALGIRKVLESKAAGYSELVKSCAGDAKAAATLLMIEKLEQLVATQVEAIKNLKIDKITVWDSGAATDGGSATSNFVAGLLKSLPPLHEIAGMAGLELPQYLGKMKNAADAPVLPVKDGGKP